MCYTDQFMPTLKKQVGYFNHEVVILFGANWRDRGWGRFIWVLETIIAKATKETSTLTILQLLIILHADSDH